MEIAHSERAHAKLSASGSKRWMSCTASVALEEASGIEDKSSTFADEGSAAHELSEINLRYQLGLNNVGEYMADTEAFVEKHKAYHGREMAENVGRYVDLVIERWHAALARDPHAVILIEQRLDFSPWTAPGQFGTGDIIIISARLLEVIDLKYGKGIPVSAVDNPQMKLYALGAINAFDMLYDFDLVRMTIVQPRLDSVSDDELTVEGLLAWAEEKVRPAAEEAMAGNGKFDPGEHCRFCKVAATCRARADANLELARHEFADPPLLSIEEIGEILGKVDDLVKWANSVEEYALKQALQGKPVPGWKLIAGTSNRKITDAKAAADRLIDKGGYKWDEIHKPPALLGIGDLEKLVGKKNFGIVLDGLLAKPPGKPALVPESDKRQELTAGSEFEALDAEEVGD